MVLRQNFYPRDVWVHCFKPLERPRLRMICFPYAGGNVLAFKEWHLHVPENVEVLAINLPGRGRRLTETPYTDMQLLVEDAAKAIKPYLDIPFAIFGHSMGALIGFELARLLRARYGLVPEHLFASAYKAPSLPRTKENIENMADEELVRKLRRMNGTPPEILDNQELLELFLPVIRADMRVLDGYKYREEAPLDCPISAIGGTEDREVPIAQLSLWERETTKAFNLKTINGNHFFIHSGREELLDFVSLSLTLLMNSSSGLRT